MLAVAALRHNTDGGHGEIDQGFSIGTDNDFPEFSDGNLLDSIDFDDLFLDMEYGEELPDLEMDPDLIAEFSINTDDEESDPNTSVSVGLVGDITKKLEDEEEEGKSGSSSSQGEENVVQKMSLKEGHDKGRSKSSSQGKNCHGKRKVKVDWTPELHRRFVQAVEQLGVDKAVPSRILEIMGIDCLTRHNIASHLQKYRSHRKHLLAREAEAASWSRRQMYGGVNVGGGKREINPWLTPAMGFPPRPMPPPPPPQPPHMHHFRPLHVWGHPSMDQSLVQMWPKHLAHLPSAPPQSSPWTPPPPPSIDPSYWHVHHQRVSNGLAQGAPCLPRPVTPHRYATPPVQGIPPPVMYKVDSGMGFAAGHSGTHQAPFEPHPSNESIDAAIEDVISKPWLPLPLGLKPPSLDGVLVELQRQGVPKIPCTLSCS